MPCIVKSVFLSGFCFSLCSLTTLYWHVFIIQLMIKTRFIVVCDLMNFSCKKNLTRRILPSLNTTNKMVIEHTITQNRKQKAIYSRNVRMNFVTFPLNIDVCTTKKDLSFFCYLFMSILV